MTNTAVPDLMGARTFAEEVYSRYALAEAPEAAATALPLFVACMVLAACTGMFRAEFAAALDTLQHGRARPIPVRGLTRCVWLGMGAAACGFLLTPFWQLLSAAGGLSILAGSLKSAAPEIARSACLSMPASLVCLFVSLPWAWSALKYRVSRACLVGVVAVLVGTPAPVVGIGLIRLLNRPGWLGSVYDSSMVTLFAMVCRSLPFALVIMALALRAVPRFCEDLGRCDGAGPWRRLWHIHLPLVWPAACAALFVAYAWSLSETEAVVLVAPPGQTVLSVRLLTLAHYGTYANVAALALVHVLMVLPPAGLVFVLRRRAFGAGRRAAHTA